MEQLTVTMPLQEYNRLKKIESEMEKMPTIRVSYATGSAAFFTQPDDVLEWVKKNINEIVPKLLTDEFVRGLDKALDMEGEVDSLIQKNGELEKENKELIRQINIIEHRLDKAYNQSIWSFIKRKLRL